ncbi:hypothetical protein SAMN02745136_03802 [Anaerocolumna jejuensis DSM 15929]|uniref:Uncharacterized protein n=1 Tax=Anaerocolumna jejuensis DSM 15929 TaxID=1121322 RepID=A0A1M6WXN0_9FIRM|nr:hypothetical protein [Anaerocolumna jejuensis]SHK98487.1 hypothetical protein SAMN02745136_03802 [Anaerocolumna jejuensis DSM 15929]
MDNQDKIKEELYTIILNDGNCIKNNEQYYFACGVALTALLFAKEYSDSTNTSIYEELLDANNLKEFRIKINTLIEQSLDYIEQLPAYKGNLFRYILDYTPSENIERIDYKESFLTGTSNSISFFETNPIPVTAYAAMHGVSPSTVRYHINKKHLKTSEKVGRLLFISKDEPYPKRLKK